MVFCAVKAGYGLSLICIKIKSSHYIQRRKGVSFYKPHKESMFVLELGSCPFRVEDCKVSKMLTAKFQSPSFHNMPANLENSAGAARLEKVIFHSNPKERQCQRMFKLPHNCTQLTCLVKYFSKFSKPGFNST